VVLLIFHGTGSLRLHTRDVLTNACFHVLYLGPPQQDGWLVRTQIKGTGIPIVLFSCLALNFQTETDSFMNISRAVGYEQALSAEISSKNKSDGGRCEIKQHTPLPNFLLLNTRPVPQFPFTANVFHVFVLARPQSSVAERSADGNGKSGSSKSKQKVGWYFSFPNENEQLLNFDCDVFFVFY
jgi:hypothetical protein